VLLSDVVSYWVEDFGNVGKVASTVVYTNFLGLKAHSCKEPVRVVQIHRNQDLIQSENILLGNTRVVCIAFQVAVEQSVVDVNSVKCGD
jgi:hypothetical protein